MTYFWWCNPYDVIKMTFGCVVVNLFEVLPCESIFKILNWPNHATLDHWNTKLAPLLVAPLAGIFLNLSACPGVSLCVPITIFSGVVKISQWEGLAGSL